MTTEHDAAMELADNLYDLFVMSGLEPNDAVGIVRINNAKIRREALLEALQSFDNDEWFGAANQIRALADKEG